MSDSNVIASGENLVDEEAMLEMLHAIVADLPPEVKVAESIVFAEDHGMASRLYKVTLSATGEAENEWNGLKMCVKWFDASKFLGDDWRLSMRELLFYRDFADEIAEVIHIPRCYGAQKSGNTISCAAFEFIEPPYQLGEQVAGMPLDEMEAAVKLIAQLHSRSIEDLPDWVLPVSRTVQAVEGVIRGAVKNIKPENVAKSLQGVDPEEACKVFAQVCAPGAWESIADLVGEGFPKHLIHFDVRGENLFIKRSEDNSKVEDLILFDWQNMAIGSAGMELAYFLPGSMTIPMRREHERDLVELYVDELQRHLGPEVKLPSKEDYWESYKLALSYVLVWASIILDNPDRVMEMIGKTEEVLKAKVMNFMITTAERNLTAVIDHSSADLLTTAIAARENCSMTDKGSSAFSSDLRDREVMMEMLQRMIALPDGIAVEESSIFGEDHGMVSNLYKVLLSAPGSDWDGRKLCVKLYEAHHFHGDDSAQAMRELRFYRDLSPMFSKKVTLPQYYGSLQCNATTSCIALELIEPPYRMPHQMEGMPLDEMEAAVKAMARFHSIPVDGFSSWLAPMDENIRSVEHYLRDPFQKITADDISRVFPDINAKEAYDALEAVCGPHVWDSLPGVLREGFPQHLLHYDYRGENLFFKRSDEDGSIEDVIIYDWQHICLGSGALELTYLLTSSMTISDRRAHEKALVELYVKELSRELGDGTAVPSADEYWRMYRIATAYLLVWAVVIFPDPVALVEQMGKKEEVVKAAALNMMVTTALRNFTAVLDHGSVALLREAIAQLKQ